jgi:hypothetical protein
MKDLPFLMVWWKESKKLDIAPLQGKVHHVFSHFGERFSGQRGMNFQIIFLEFLKAHSRSS